ncbi:MAG: nicotinamide riboside transporter PnuC, partial [Bacteroidota bacterium]
DITAYNLYSDAILQAFYVVMSGVGLFQWLRGGANQSELVITRMRQGEHGLIIVTGAASGLILGYFVGAYLPAAATYPDALTTSFSVVATFLLLQRRLENWLYWIVIDMAYVAIYWSRGATLFVVIMIIYVVVAIMGYRTWRRLYTNEHLG